MFRFTRKPAQALTGASPVTLTLNPFPQGITSGSVSTPHYLRITDAVAGSENVLITARTSSTVTFTPVLSHTSGNWSIGSATNGIQEAVKWVESQVNGGSVLLEFGNSIIFKTVYFVGSPGVTIFGQGNWASIIISDSTFTSGDFFYCGANTCLVNFVNVHMGAGNAQTSGAGIHFKDVRVQGATLTNVRFENN
jgi:hypothetical protein